MIYTVYERILVRVNTEQKEYANIGGVECFLAQKYNPNNREKSPVLAYVIVGNDEIKEGFFIITHHNYFVEYSPFHVDADIYSIPYSENIFVVIDSEGNAAPVCGNITAERIEENEAIGMADPKRLHYHDRVRVLSGACGFKKDDEILTLPFSDYEILYNWNGIEKRIIRVYSKNIVAVLK